MPPHAAVRTRTAPIHPRRVSGPARPAPAVALPPGRTGVFERLRGVPDSRAVDRLLRSRAWIWVVGIMLGGIVAMQVSLLRLNSGISRAVQTQDTLVRQNADLEASIAGLASGDRVRANALQDRMIDPAAGDTRYLTARPDIDPLRALKRMRAPSDEARAVMDNGGFAPGTAPAATTVAPAGGAAAVTPVATPAATPALATAAATPAATPVATATPVITPVATAPPVQTPVPTAAPGTGAVAAPQG